MSGAPARSAVADEPGAASSDPVAAPAGGAMAADRLSGVVMAWGAGVAGRGLADIGPDAPDPGDPVRLERGRSVPGVAVGAGVDRARGRAAAAGTGRSVPAAGLSALLTASDIARAPRRRSAEGPFSPARPASARSRPFRDFQLFLKTRYVKRALANVMLQRSAGEALDQSIA